MRATGNRVINAALRPELMNVLLSGWNGLTAGARQYRTSMSGPLSQIGKSLLGPAILVPSIRLKPRNAARAGCVPRLSFARRLGARVESALLADLARPDAQSSGRGEVRRGARVPQVDERASRAAGLPARRKDLYCGPQRNDGHNAADEWPGSTPGQSVHSSQRG